MISTNEQKENAALRAVTYVKNGMVVGLGSGSTSAHAVKVLGKKVAQGLDIKGVPTSGDTGKLAEECGISLTTLQEVTSLDVTLDGADEFDPYFQLIKGGGGALLREKIVASVSRLNVIMVDEKKQVSRLGKFKLPVEVIPFAAEAVKNRLGVDFAVRMEQGSTFVTDEGNYILDLDIWPITNLADFNDRLLHIPGVVETGLFLDSTDIVVVGKQDGTVEVLERGLIRAI